MSWPRALHPAERKYMLDAANGLTAQQSARRHEVSVRTVEHSLMKSKEALGAITIAHAVALALKCSEFTTDDVSEQGPR